VFAANIVIYVVQLLGYSIGQNKSNQLHVNQLAMMFPRTDGTTKIESIMQSAQQQIMQQKQ